MEIGDKVAALSITRGTVFHSTIFEQIDHGNFSSLSAKMTTNWSASSLSTPGSINISKESQKWKRLSTLLPLKLITFWRTTRFSTVLP